MKRRDLLALSTVALAAPGLAAAAAAKHVTYSPAAYQAALANGEPLLLDFFAPW